MIFKNIIILLILLFIIINSLKIENFSRPSKCFDCERQYPKYSTTKCFTCMKQIGDNGGNTKCFSCINKKLNKPKKCIMCERNEIINIV